MRAKRFISVILSILIVCSSFAGLTVFADDANKNERTKDVASVGAEVSDKYSVASPDEAVQDQSGTTGECTWTYDASTKTLTISGNGDMGSYDDWEAPAPWHDFRDNINKVVIENGVTSIGEDAFYYCTSLTSVTIPDSVTSIGEDAFYYCTSLTSVTIPDSVTSIGESAFNGCTSLTSVTIPDSVTSIEWATFSGCTSLTSVTIPDSVTSIDCSAFRGCTSLSKIEVDENNQAYSSLNGDLYNKSQTELIQYAVGKKDNTFVIPNSVTSIGEDAFYGCTSLTSVNIPSSVTYIEARAFRGCKNLNAVYITDLEAWCNIDFVSDDDSEGLDDNVLSSNPLLYAGNLYLNGELVTNLVIQDGVTIVGGKIKKDGVNYYYCNSPFLGCTSLTSLTIPDSVTSIGNYAFWGCTGLTKVTIPDTVTSIDNYAFYGCTGLTQVTIPNSVTNIGIDAFSETACYNNQPDGVIYVDNWVVDYKGNMPKNEKIVLINGTRGIANRTFYNKQNLSDIIIPDSVTIIGEWTFSFCTALTNMTIGNGVTSIGQFAFHGNTSLVDVYYGGSIEEWNKISFGFRNNNLLNANIHYAYKVSQTITGVEPKYDVAFGDEPFNLNAKAGTALTYVSSNSKVAEVSADGTVTINGVGTATITITAEETENYNSASATVEITINKSIQEITGFEPKYDVTLGDKPFNLNAKAETALSYVSDNTIVAEVSADGTVTIKGKGKATITITAEETDNYKSATATVEITVNKVGQEISVDKQDYKLTNGAKPFSLNAKAETALSYASDNTSVAEVSADGTVTIKGAGKATITITAEETTNYNSATATVEITVGKASQEVTGFEPKYEVTFGDKPISLNAKAETALSYASDNTSVAEVSTDGTVTIKGAGKATITITAEETANYNSATATVEITVGKASQEVTGFESKYEVTFGDKPISLNAKAETALSYASDNTSVAEVSTDGTVTINSAGKATITITAEETANYKSATATVEITVNKAGQEVSVDKESYKLTYGAKPFSLNAKAETALSYVSSNPKVAYVSADGTVTIKGVGIATITITAKENNAYNSATATVKITVAKATQKVTGVKTQYVTSAGKSFILKPKAKTKLTYTSSNKNVAVVSSTGKVTVKAGGYAYITVKASENGNYKSAYVKTKIISAPRDFTSKDVSKVKKTGKTTAKITWKSLAGAKGYTVQLATNKTFKGAKTVKNSKNTATLTGLKKGKTYYVRINAYTKVSGKNYSNKWYTVKFKM